MGKQSRKSSPERDINKSPKKDDSNDSTDSVYDSIQNIIDLLVKLKKKKIDGENADSLDKYLKVSVDSRIRTYDDEDERFKNYGEKIIRKKTRGKKKVK